MRQIQLPLKSGAVVEFDMPAPGTGRSYFLVSLPKAGSSMFYQLMRPISTKAGFSYFSLPDTLYRLGIPTAQLAGDVSQVFDPVGYAFGGFRGIELPTGVPAFGSGRTAFLVRDPRDMVTSLYFSEAFSHVEPGSTTSDHLLRQFKARREAALTEPINDYVLRRASGILHTYDQALARMQGIDHRLYRYEDVIFDKTTWMIDLLTYLEVDLPRNVLERIVARCDVRPAEEDPSKHVRRVTPGDHREKLTGDTIERLNAVFQPMLSRLNYS